MYAVGMVMHLSGRATGMIGEMCRMVVFTEVIPCSTTEKRSEFQIVSDRDSP